MMNIQAEPSPENAGNVCRPGDEPVICVTVSELASSFERRGIGIIVLDESNEIILISKIARDQLTYCGVPVVGNRILPAENEESRLLQELMDRHAPREAAQVLSCPQTNHWLVVHSRMAPIATGPEAEPAWYRVLSLRDPAQISDRDVQTLTRLLGLTHRESELACYLAGGHAPAQFAEQQHVSLNTVRSHLKRVYRKLGVGNQAEMVARVLAILR